MTKFYELNQTAFSPVDILSKHGHKPEKKDMKFYLLSRKDKDWHFEHLGFVVVAPNEGKAREIANVNDTTSEDWQEPSLVDCYEIVPDHEKMVFGG